MPKGKPNVDWNCAQERSYKGCAEGGLYDFPGANESGEWSGNFNSSVAPGNDTPEFAGFRAWNSKTSHHSLGGGNPFAGKS